MSSTQPPNSEPATEPTPTQENPTIGTFNLTMNIPRLDEVKAKGEIRGLKGQQDITINVPSYGQKMVPLVHSYMAKIKLMYISSSPQSNECNHVYCKLCCIPDYCNSGITDQQHMHHGQQQQPPYPGGPGQQQQPPYPGGPGQQQQPPYPGGPGQQQQPPYPGGPGQQQQPPYPGGPGQQQQPPYPGGPGQQQQPPYPGGPGQQQQPPYPGGPGHGTTVNTHDIPGVVLDMDTDVFLLGNSVIKLLGNMNALIFYNNLDSPAEIHIVLGYELVH